MSWVDGLHLRIWHTIIITHIIGICILLCHICVIVWHWGSYHNWHGSVLLKFLFGVMLILVRIVEEISFLARNIAHCLFTKFTIMNEMRKLHFNNIINFSDYYYLQFLLSQYLLYYNFQSKYIIVIFFITIYIALSNSYHQQYLQGVIIHNISQIMKNKKKDKNKNKHSKNNKEQQKMVKLFTDLLVDNNKVLKLDERGITTLNIKYITYRSWKQVSILHLNNNRIGDNGILSLAKGNWRNLGFLNLSDNKLTAEWVKYFKLGKWPKLQLLHICKFLLNRKQQFKCNICFIVQHCHLPCFKRSLAHKQSCVSFQ